MTGIPGVDVVIPQGEPLPAFDYWIQLMSIPAMFGTTVDSIPRAIPYLAADPECARGNGEARLRAHDGLKVGLVWAGNPDQPNDRRRSMSLSQLLPLLEVEGVQFFALQKGARETEADAMAPGKPLTNLAAGTARSRRHRGGDRGNGPGDLGVHVDGASRGCVGQAGVGALVGAGGLALADGAGGLVRGIRRRGCSGRSAEGIGTR